MSASGPLTSFWDALPEPLRAKLRLGCTGKLHLLDMAGWCLRSGAAALRPLAADFLQTALGENPLDGAMAHELLGLEPVRAVLPQPTLETLRALADNWRRPDDLSAYDALRAGRDFSRIREAIDQNLERAPGNLFWREQALFMGMVDGDPEWTASRLDMDGPEGAQPIFNNIRALFGRLRRECYTAARLTEMTGDAFGVAYPALTSGLCLLEGGERDAASLLFLDALARAPWNTSLLLRTHDLLTGADLAVAPVAGSVTVLLYSWNKAIELDATLSSLYSSDLGEARLFVLDNGSTDRTAEVLESWRLRFGDRLAVITLPVNVGAPVARNWLLHLPEVERSDFVVYLDDDVVLPEDWLGRLGAAARAYPDAGVWGCRVVDHANPLLVQHADGHLLVEDDPSGGRLDTFTPNPFKLSDLFRQGMDSGLFDYMRPCASVTGCCHMFRTQTLLESGDFALQLSPSQYDDYEHDLRLAEAGKFAVYTGHLRVRHKKRSGVASRTSAAAEGNALANRYKMQTMHERRDVLRAAEAGQKLIDADLRAKMAVVEERLGCAC
ncbi:glycosyltransferase family 2 protein [Salidesulfovibrio onnuriiensis]|uniref:glycosyltransferase family 2 protein n=1 Tax=Salidesulfovibrio onnuriiensis TaxID=2583823 RepID=UPI0011CA6333|nr:glycosyltransferase [Salidesulfovibrio onnuriiensis]